MGYIKDLDGFRAVAVIAVMCVHYGILGAGWIGVQMFFVLSGYLITFNLLRDRFKTDSVTYYLKNFYWRRFLRLFPLYYVYIIFFLLIGFYYDNHQISKLIIPLFTYTINIYALLPSHADFTNVGHFWSLAVEEQFYLFWPIIIFYFTAKFKRIIIYLILCGPVLRFFIFQMACNLSGNVKYAGEVVNLLTISQIDAFATGAAVVLFSKINIKRPKVVLFVMLLFVASVGGLNLFSLKYGNNISESPQITTFGFPWLMLKNYQYVWGYSLLNIFFGLLIWNIVNGKISFPILKNSFLVYIGKISYGIYVFHVPVLFLIHYFKKVRGIVSFPEILIYPALYFAITILIATVSYELYEKRFLKLKDQINASVNI